MKTIYIDLETTGLDPAKNGIVQLAGMIEIDGEVKESFDFKMQPFEKQIVTEESLVINNLSMDIIKTYPKPLTAYKQFSDILCSYVDRFDKTDKFVIVGYNNSKFDDNFLRVFFENSGDKYYGSMFWWPSIDVAILAMNLVKEHRSKFVNFKLSSVAAFFGIDIEEEKLHDALYDVYLTREIFKKIEG